MNEIPDQKRSRAVARRIEGVLAEALRADPARVIELMDACRSSLVAGSHSEDEELEIARRTAEAKVSILFDRENATDDFLASWASLEQLGYSSSEREASMLVYFLKFCMRTNNNSRRRDALNRLDALVEEMAASGNDSLSTHYRAVVNSIKRAD